MWRRREPAPELPLDREDVVTIMDAVHEIRTNTRRMLWILEDDDAEKKRRMSPDERPDELGRRLEERIAFHKAKLAEEREIRATAERVASERRRRFRWLIPFR